MKPLIARALRALAARLDPPPVALTAVYVDGRKVWENAAAGNATYNWTWR